MKRRKRDWLEKRERKIMREIDLIMASPFLGRGESDLGDEFEEQKYVISGLIEQLRARTRDLHP